MKKVVMIGDSRYSVPASYDASAITAEDLCHDSSIQFIPAPDLEKIGAEWAQREWDLIIDQGFLERLNLPFTNDAALALPLAIDYEDENLRHEEANEIHTHAVRAWESLQNEAHS